MPGSRLLLLEREEIRAGIVAGESLSGIARRLGRAPSTVCREVEANGGAGVYRAVAGQERAERLGCRPKVAKLVADPELAEEVTRLIRECRYSPRVCSQILAEKGRRVSHETIYQACYRPGRGLGSEVWKFLARRRQRRKHAGHRWGFASGNPLGEPTSVHQRHRIATERTQCGHLEGDLLIGAHNRSAIIVITERVSRYQWLGALPSGYGTENVAAALVALLDTIPPRMRRTLTWDQGREMKYWADIQAACGTPIYFCDPHAPWQKPTVENQNGILRRWLPKGTPLNHTQTDLDNIAQLINHMPRRIHQWQTAHTIYHAHLVATTG